jgi:hypothetical protein
MCDYTQSPFVVLVKKKRLKAAHLFNLYCQIRTTHRKGIIILTVQLGNKHGAIALFDSTNKQKSATVKWRYSKQGTGDLLG